VIVMNACALVIGINAYQKSDIPTLFGAVADAADFADWALDPAGGNVGNDQLYFWTSPAPVGPSARLQTFLANPTPWHNNVTPNFSRPPDADEIIKTALKMATTLSGAAGRIYVFMAGHGVQTVPLDAQRDPQTCFVAGDFEPNATTFGLIPCDDLRRGLLMTGFFSQAFMFFDCCRSPMSLNQPSPPLPWPFAPAQDAASYGVGRAAKRGAKAYEIPEREPSSRGAFTKVLLEGLRRYRSAANMLTLNDLENYVSSAIQNLLGEGRQYPQFDLEPRQPPFCLLNTAVTNPIVPIDITLEDKVPRPLQLVGPDGTVIQAQINGPGRVNAPAGTVYSLETPDHSFSYLFKHDGPEPTNVKVKAKVDVNVQP
jgi:hypothetical protein